MNIHVEGDGSFGKFLKQELPRVGFKLDEKADSVILAVPLDAYKDCSRQHIGKHLINVCSVQKPSTDICLNYTDMVTSIHPLFGARTPDNKRTSIVTRRGGKEYVPFLLNWLRFSRVRYKFNDEYFTPESHDRLMVRTHVAAILAAKQLKHFVDEAADVPDELIPNSFRLLRQFVQTLEDTPAGTVSSIMANPYHD